MSTGSTLSCSLPRITLNPDFSLAIMVSSSLSVRAMEYSQGGVTEFFGEGFWATNEFLATKKGCIARINWQSHFFARLISFLELLMTSIIAFLSLLITGEFSSREA